jgi:hypothetical protein
VRISEITPNGTVKGFMLEDVGRALQRVPRPSPEVALARAAMYGAYRLLSSAARTV